MNNFDTELKERTAYVEKIVYDYCPKRGISVYGSNGNDSYIFIST